MQIPRLGGLVKKPHMWNTEIVKTACHDDVSHTDTSQDSPHTHCSSIGFQPYTQSAHIGFR